MEKPHQKKTFSQESQIEKIIDFCFYDLIIKIN